MGQKETEQKQACTLRKITLQREKCKKKSGKSRTQAGRGEKKVKIDLEVISFGSCCLWVVVRSRRA